jgi:ferritin-like metal-binding protein YciE
LLRKHDASPQDASEQKILKSLPKMIDKATNRDLVAGLKSHLEETNKQVERLQKVFEKLGKQASGTQCPAIDGIIKEADETAGEIGDKAVLDAAIVANAQAVEHDEMCRYGTLIAWAEELGHNEIVRFQSRGRSVRVRAARSERHLQRTYQAATETIRQASDMMNVAGMLSAPPTKNNRERQQAKQSGSAPAASRTAASCPRLAPARLASRLGGIRVSRPALLTRSGFLAGQVTGGFRVGRDCCAGGLTRQNEAVYNEQIN